MLRKILIPLIITILMFSCNYDIIEPDVPAIPAITFRKTFPADDPAVPTKIIRGHDNRYVISGYLGNPAQGFVTMLDSLGIIVPGFPTIAPAPSTVMDIEKTEFGYASIGWIIDNNNVFYSALVGLSKDGLPLKTTLFGSASNAVLLHDMVKTNSGFAFAGFTYANNEFFRYFATANSSGDIIVNTRYKMNKNQIITAFSFYANSYLAVGPDYDNGKLMLTFINQNGYERKPPIYLGGSQKYDPYGIVRYENGFAILGKYDFTDKFSECFLILCDEEGNELNNSTKHLGIYSDKSNYYGAGIVKTQDGGFAIVGQSTSKNIILLLFDKNGNKKDNSPIEFNHAGEQNGQSLFQTEDGGFVIAGTTMESGSTQILVLKTDKDGKIN